MERSEISLDEKAFLIGNLDIGLRNDGRTNFQYRPLEIETDCVKRAMGSARVRIGENIVIATVKGDLFTPPVEVPDRGKLEFYIDWSPDGASRMVGWKRDSNKRVCFMLNEAYRGIETGGLCIASGAKCWRLEVSLLVVAAGGGLYDTVSFAVKAALASTRLPSIKEVQADGDDIDVKINDTHLLSLPPQIGPLPNIITLSKVGKNYVVDPSYEESLCSELSLVVSINGEGKVLSIFKEGCGCVHPSALEDNFKVLAGVSKTLEKEFEKALSVHLKSRD